MTKELMDYVSEKSRDLMAAPSCYAGAKAAAQACSCLCRLPMIFLSPRDTPLAPLQLPRLYSLASGGAGG